MKGSIQMSFGSKILNYREDILKDLAELITIPSVRSEAEEGMPFGKEPAKALNRILGMAGSGRSRWSRPPACR